MSIDKSHLKEMIKSRLGRYHEELTKKGVKYRTSLLSEPAVSMLLSIAAHESHLGTYFYQIGGGPARGLFGMEIPTEQSIWSNFLTRKNKWRSALANVTKVLLGHPHNEEALVYNLSYQIILARIYLWQEPAPLPPANHLDLQASYWAKYWKRANVSPEDISDFRNDVIIYL